MRLLIFASLLCVDTATRDKVCDTLNRILWHAQMGVDTPYPDAFAGAHGKGLTGLELILTGDDDDDD